MIYSPKPTKQIYGPVTHPHLRAESLANLHQLASFLAYSPELMKVQLRLGFVWGENCLYLGPREYMESLETGLVCLSSQSQRKGGKVEVEVHVRTHPRFMDEWVDVLVRTFFSCEGDWFVGFVVRESLGE